MTSYPVPDGSHPHDVAPALAGGVWYTAQGSGELGLLDPATGDTEHIDLGPGSSPHGVITDASGAAWITDGGLNAIVRVDASTHEAMVFALPEDHPDANLNTAAFDGNGDLWFTGQSGIVGRLDPSTGEIAVFEAPDGRGPYGITATPTGSIFFASLGGSYLGEVAADGTVTVIEPPTPGQGARRVWAASDGALWVSEWNSGDVSRYQPDTAEWTTWRLPGESPQAYAVYVDEYDIVWLSDFGANAMLSFDPEAERFHEYPLPHQPGEVRQILGRLGQVWGAESAADHLVMISAPG
jgi:virginiamycin B lyase